MSQSKHPFVVVAFVLIVVCVGAHPHDACATDPSGSGKPSPRITEADIARLVATQNKTLPLMTSEHLQLTKLVAGPGLQITYEVKIVADEEGVAKVVTADRGQLKDDILSESCGSLEFGLKAGISYVMSYSAPDGTKLFEIPLLREDCGF